MPNYQYLCNNCSLFDYHQSIHDNQLSSCPYCKSEQIKKVFSAPTVRFVGGGFYSTDNKGGK